VSTEGNIWIMTYCLSAGCTVLRMKTYLERQSVWKNYGLVVLCSHTLNWHNIPFTLEYGPG